MKKAIVTGIKNGKSLDELWNELVNFKVKGGTQKEAIKILEELRTELPEEKEDIILELLDFATGWCQQRFRIW